ncbi:hypothetical protein [Phaffia rhodozyma]|uniref:Uncharacterized protein n=1 Tax=Phaffia rhodozyma TaxID=264483 RepID=A0A0F7SH97_PHARH|nr:hypothetical protein [Phaffia rhodozyma]
MFLACCPGALVQGVVSSRAFSPQAFSPSLHPYAPRLPPRAQSQDSTTPSEPSVVYKKKEPTPRERRTPRDWVGKFHTQLT